MSNFKLEEPTKGAGYRALVKKIDDQLVSPTEKVVFKDRKPHPSTVVRNLSKKEIHLNKVKHYEEEFTLLKMKLISDIKSLSNKEDNELLDLTIPELIDTLIDTLKDSYV